MKWTLAKAWEEHGSYDLDPSVVGKKSLTEADFHLAEMAKKAVAAPNETEAAKIMHVALAYCIPFLTKNPKAIGENGKPIQGQKEVNEHVAKKAIEALIGLATYDGEKPSKSLIAKLNKHSFDKITAHEWYEIWNALGHAEFEHDELTRKFYDYACESWGFLDCRNETLS